MRIRTNLILLLLLSLATFQLACTQSNADVNGPATNRAGTDQPLLEVYSVGGEMTYPPGRVLKMRLYPSGRVEYDHYPPPSPGKRPELTRRETHITSGDMQRVLKLVNGLKSTEVEKEYPATVPIMDASITTTVNFRSGGENFTTVLHENHSNLILEKKEGVYPQPLLELLRFIDDFHSRMLK